MFFSRSHCVNYKYLLLITILTSVLGFSGLSSYPLEALEEIFTSLLPCHWCQSNENHFPNCKIVNYNN